MRDAAPLFAALGDETRLRLLVRLSAGGPLSIARLSRRGPTSRGRRSPSTSTCCRDAGLVRGSRRGRERIWELEPRRLAEAQRYLDRISRQWDEALERLRQLVEGP